MPRRSATSCTHGKLSQPTIVIYRMAEALAHEAALTGNPEHLRILREGFRAMMPKGDDWQVENGKFYGIITHFAPYALRIVEERN